jgi:hypothetical protein
MELFEPVQRMKEYVKSRSPYRSPYQFFEPGRSGLFRQKAVAIMGSKEPFRDTLRHSGLEEQKVEVDS